MATKSKFNASSSTKPLRTKVKPTVVHEPVIDEAMAQYNEAREELYSAFNVPSKTRLLVSFIAGIVSYATSIYWGIQAIELLTIAAISLTGVGFIAYLVWFLGIALVFFGSMIAGWQTAKVVLDYVPGTLSRIGSSIRDSAKSKTSLVRSWFQREPAAA